MKICFLTHAYPRFTNDTTAPFIESIAETLQKNEVDVTVLTPDTPKFSRTTSDHNVNLKTYRYFFPRQMQLLGYSNTLINDAALKKSAYLLAPFMCISSLFNLIRLHQKHRFDVIHAQWLLPNGFVAAIIARLFNVPLVITLHGSDMFVSKLNPVFKQIAKWTLKQTAMVTSVTPTFLTDLADLGVPKEKRCLTLYGVDPDMFLTPPHQQLTELREKLEISEKHPVIFALGRIVLKKGFDTLLHALPLIKENGFPHVTLVIAGDGTDLGRLKNLANELGVSESVRFPGTVPRSAVPTYFHLGDIFAFPAVFDPKGNVDGCPNVILEAMASGKPVVASGISGIPAVVKDGETGILTPEKDVQHLAHALVELLQDTAKRKQFGAAGRQRILNKLTWDKVVNQFKDIYQHSVKNNA